MPAIPMQSTQPLRTGPPEQRSYPLISEVEYKQVDGRGTRTGRGRTVTISTAAVVFTPDDPLAVGNGIELSIAWPVALTDRVGLRLWVRGTVVENVANRVTLEIMRYEFRTRLRRQDATSRTRTMAASEIA